MKIKLFCLSGMSTSLLVTKMREAAKKRGLDVEIEAYAESAVAKESDDCDIALLGPQVGYQLKKAKEVCDPKNIPIAVISMVDYGTMNGEKVLDLALSLKK